MNIRYKLISFLSIFQWNICLPKCNYDDYLDISQQERHMFNLTPGGYIDRTEAIFFLIL